MGLHSPEDAYAWNAERRVHECTRDAAKLLAAFRANTEDRIRLLEEAAETGVMVSDGFDPEDEAEVLRHCMLSPEAEAVALKTAEDAAYEREGL